MSLPQNPYRCSSSGCVLLVPGRPSGVSVSGPCRCLHGGANNPADRVRVRNGIAWLTHTVATEEELAMDRVLYGNSFQDEDGARVDPRRVLLKHDGTYRLLEDK